MYLLTSYSTVNDSSKFYKSLMELEHSHDEW